MQTPLPNIPRTDRVYVVFTAEIVPQTTEALIQTLCGIAQNGVNEVYLAISTPGGSVMHGMTLYNFLRGVPFRLTTHNIGNVDSIGNAVFLAGQKRLACPNSTFMFHGVGFNQEKGSRLEEKALREMLGGIESDQTRIGAIIAERTLITSDEAKGLFREAQTKTAEFARDRGIIHEVEEFRLPPSQPVVSFVFNR